MFYAALELRCAVETRLKEYLEPWSHVSKKQKEGWHVANLSKAAEKAFKIGNRIMRMSFLETNTKRPLAILYYTPITSKLKQNVERLGNYLHAAKHRSLDDPWWTRFRHLLDKIEEQVTFATTGTLIGPSLIKGRNGQLYAEVPVGVDLMQYLQSGAQTIVSVDYLDHLPHPLEEVAIIMDDGYRQQKRFDTKPSIPLQERQS